MSRSGPTPPAIVLDLKHIGRLGLAQHLFARLFPERGLDLARLAKERRDAARAELWFGAEGTGLRVERVTSMQWSRDGEYPVESDVLLEAGAPHEARWFRLRQDATDALTHIEVGLEDPSLAAAIRDEIFRKFLGTSEVRFAALLLLQGLRGLQQDVFGTPPASLERVRLPLHVLDAVPGAPHDPPLAEALPRLDAAAADGAPRAHLVAAVLLARSGASEAALARLDALLAAHPGEPDAAGLRARLLAAGARKDPSALPAARAAAEALDVTDARDYVLRAVTLVALGAQEAALAQLDAGAPRELGGVAAIAGAVLAGRLGDEAGARRRAAALIARDPTLARVHAQRAPQLLVHPLLARLDTFEAWQRLYAAVTRPS
jgi:hypothetical protein